MQPAKIAPKDRLIVPLDLPGTAEAELLERFVVRRDWL